MSRGFLLGKFLPPHLGHAFLIDFAHAFCGDVTVLACSIPSEPIPGDLRLAWLSEHFAGRDGVRIAACTDPLPQAPEDDPENFWRLWRDACLSRLDAPPEFVFASEPYGHRLAAELGARFVPVDIDRSLVPVSGTMIRNAPRRHWDFLLPPARPHFLRKVALVGPESAGKTTLARRLATHYQTVWAGEWARGYIDSHAPALDADLFATIVRGHRAAEDALARQARRVLFCDTDSLTTVLWARRLLGEVPDSVADAADAPRYDLHLLLPARADWEPDPQRFQPDRAERERFTDDLRALLDERGWPYVVLPTDRAAAFAAAVEAVETQLD